MIQLSVLQPTGIGLYINYLNFKNKPIQAITCTDFFTSKKSSEYLKYFFNEFIHIFI